MVINCSYAQQITGLIRLRLTQVVKYDKAKAKQSQRTDKAGNTLQQIVARLQYTLHQAAARATTYYYIGFSTNKRILYARCN